MCKLAWVMLLALCSGVAAGDDLMRRGEPYGNVLPDPLISAYDEYGVKGGIYYRIDYSDGEAVFGVDESDDMAKSVGGDRWHATCRRDAMSGGRMCLGYRGALKVAFFSDGKYAVIAGSRHYPGRKAYIKVDSGGVFSASAGAKGVVDGRAAAKLVKQMMKGQRVLVRYTAWPDDAAVDEEVDVSNVWIVFDYLSWAVKRMEGK